MEFTARLNRIKESLTIGMAKKARELKAEGKDIISLSLGEPDFDTPNHVKEAAIQAIHLGKNKVHPSRWYSRVKKSHLCQIFKRL